MAKKMPELWLGQSSSPWSNLLFFFLHDTDPAFVLLFDFFFVFLCGFCFNGSNGEEAILELKSWAVGAS